ncbi:GntR family transcriptional regulator [Leisingera sp. S232]|uniref:GntR family transcriptional regulator n=1 Tax=Leisingera sp. S232 TaxID=3415132 RepID=UPI00086BEEF3|nr:hypothetical protein AB838_16390 [Rhodobacteraceae bacterium (ex Bugula neritina AB1)]
MAKAEKADKASVNFTVYSELRKSLMLGKIEPGASLRIQELAEQFGTSHMPVREALRRLVSEQALTVLSNRSVAVPPLTNERYEDILRTRITLEGATVAWACDTINNLEIAELERLDLEIEAAREAGDKSAFLERHLQFHFLIYRCARSNAVLPLIESLWLQIGPYHHHMFEADHYKLRTRHHRELVAALHKRDKAAATKALQDDLMMFAADIRPRLSKVLES